MIIGIMFYPNPLVFMAFQTIAYTVKLNIEMSMANLIRRIATSRENDFEIDGTHAMSMRSGAAGHGAGTGVTGAAMLSRSRSDAGDGAYAGRVQATSWISGPNERMDDGASAQGKLSDDERRIVVTEEYELCHV